MNRIIPILAALALLSAACTKELHENGAVPQKQHTLEAKLVGGADGEIIPGTVLVKLDEAAAAKIRKGAYAEISADLFGDIEVKSFSDALPIKPKNMEVAKKYGLHQWFSVRFDEELKPQTVARRLAVSKNVRSVQFDRWTTPINSEQPIHFAPLPETRAAAETDTYFNDKFAYHQWNLHNDGTIAAEAVEGADVGVKDAWRLSVGDPSVIVAIFDCGLEVRHEDLEYNIWVNTGETFNGKDDDGNGFIDDVHGFNFVNCINITTDYTTGKLNGEDMPAIKSEKMITSEGGTGHGTHVAGIIAATNNNNKGVSSIAGGDYAAGQKGVSLMSCQIFQGSSKTSDAKNALAFIYAADNGACIAQCSWGVSSVLKTDDEYKNGNKEQNWDGAPLTLAAIKYFTDPDNSNHEYLSGGNIAVFAAGNLSEPYSMYPGALSDMISVTAIGYDFLPAGYTHYGPGCNIAAPGGEFQGSDKNASMILSTGGLGLEIKNQPPGVITDKGESKSYVYMQGTSMACPHVSGVLALGISYAKKLGKPIHRDDIVSMLLTSVNDIDQYTASGTKSFYRYNETKKDYEYIDIPLSRFHKQIGTGAVDAWKFLMAIEGTPSVIVGLDVPASIDLSDYCNPSNDYKISMDEQTRNSLGLETDPFIRNGKLELTCTKVGAGKIVLSSSVGKDTTMEGGIGSMDYSREISIVSRQFATKNGGWL